MKVLRRALVGWEAPRRRSWLAAVARGERRRRFSWLIPQDTTPQSGALAISEGDKAVAVHAPP
jgi:hypothetical protein